MVDVNRSGLKCNKLGLSYRRWITFLVGIEAVNES